MLNITTYNEDELIHLLQKQDKPSFNFLFENYSGSLYSIVLQIVPDREVASDVLQDVFVKIWQKIHSYDPSRGRLFTWMLNIARNSAIDMVRFKRYQNGLKTDSVRGGIHFNKNERITYLDVNNVGLRKVIEILSPAHRNLIELTYFKGHTNLEIAKMQNMPLGTVKTGIRNALRQLRVYLNRQDSFFRENHERKEENNNS